jgi:hypothetical protein
MIIEVTVTLRLCPPVINAAAKIDKPASQETSEIRTSFIALFLSH